jgi:hypothetical protein
MYGAWKSFDVFSDPCVSVPFDGPACYAVYIDGGLVYIGSTVNLRCRLAGHKIQISRYSSWIITPWGDGRTVFVKYRPSRSYGDWAMVELRLLRRLKPKGNIAHVQRGRHAQD